MSDPKNVLDGLGDLDWDNALDEWEKTSFTPEVARDAETNAPAEPLGPEPIVDAPRPRAESMPTAPPAEGYADGPISDPAIAAAGPEGTLIAKVPRELRPPAEAPPSMPAPAASSRSSLPPARPSAPPSAARGGLGQLFSRPRDSAPAGATEASATNQRPSQVPPKRPSLLPPIANHDSEKTAIAPPYRPELLRAIDPGSATQQQIAKPAALPFEERESERTLVRHTPSSAPRPQPADDGVASFERDANGDLVSESAIEDLPPDDDTAERPVPRAFAIVATVEPEDEADTSIHQRVERPSLEDAETATRHPADEEAVTVGHPSTAPAAPNTARMGLGSVAPPPEPVASLWLDATKTTALTVRIAWLEDEARALYEPLARARALLAVSELCAIAGDRERAHAFAVEARDLAPALPLGWRQARQLMPDDPELLAEALDAEAVHAPTPSARAHATLLAADVLRLSGNGDAAVERWESAGKLDPADPRAPIARAALALAQDDHSSGSLQLADNSELTAFDKAIATSLRLRGVAHKGAEPHEMPINDGLRHARIAIGQGDLPGAAQAITSIAAVPELAKGALWLSASLGSAHIASRRAAARALKTLATDGDDLARRQLAARGIELGDPELVAFALKGDADAFSTAEHAILRILGAAKGEPDLTAGPALDDGALASLDDAITALFPIAPSAPDAPVADDARKRAERTSGLDDARVLGGLGRLLAARAGDAAIDQALAAMHTAPNRPLSASASGVAIESAVRAKRFTELSEALTTLPAIAGSGDAQRHIAAAIIAERAGDRERAKLAWNNAVAPSNGEAGGFRFDGMLRIAADLDREVDLGVELLRLADTLPDTLATAVLRLEAIARGAVAEEEQAPVLERVHRAAPTLGIGGFLAERNSRRRGDVDDVLRWLHERRSYATDPLETALDAVREAFLVADRDAELASTRLEEAHLARPDDVALRELYERLSPELPEGRGHWREKRAASNEKRTRESAALDRASLPPGAAAQRAAILWLDAALEHEREHNAEAALRAARRAKDAGDSGLSLAIVERNEILTGDTTTQTEQLIELTRVTEDETVKRETLERLASLDAFAKQDIPAATMWHRSILEAAPLHKPSLRWLEHVFVGEARDDELASVFEQIAIALDGSTGGEVTGHAQHAARLRSREASAAGHAGPSAWERTFDMATLAATQPDASVWALRTLNAHARIRRDDETVLATTLALLDRTQRPAERASLLLRASESAARLERVGEARTYLEQAATEDPGDVVTWGFLAEVRERVGEPAAAAEACESLARTSGVPEHRLLAWYDAAKIWLDEVADTERGMTALEAAAEIDPTHADVFPRLSALYADRKLDAELAHLLERRLATVQDDEERVSLEVELARAFADMGELGKAKRALENALETRPDHTTALASLADLCVREADWVGAEHAYVRLVRRTVDPSEQRAIYERLAEIYSVHAPNLSRAEVALKEVQKRSPDDPKVREMLVDVYRRQGDVQKAAQAQQAIIAAAVDPNARLAALVELAKIHETVGNDPRRSEQVLDGARKEYPTSVVALRSMAEFYARQRQMPAMQILLDRAAGDARRAFAQGRFVPSLFQVLHAAFELRGKKDAAEVVAATLAAVEGQPSRLVGAEARAVDPRLDDLLAPELISPALRALFVRAGDTLDVVAPVDLRTLRATPLPPGTSVGATVGSVATVVGLGALQILVSPQLGRVALPLASNPPTLLVGEGLAKATNERARLFVVTRALKMILAHASAMIRVTPNDVSPLIAGLFNAFNPSFIPQGVDGKRMSDYARRIGPALPKNLDPTSGVIALEAAGMLGSQWPALAGAAAAWANRVALLAVGDPNGALDAIAWDKNEDAAPTDSEERAAWIARHAEARELMTFSVTDAYAEARIRLGLDK